MDSGNHTHPLSGLTLNRVLSRSGASNSYSMSLVELVCISSDPCNRVAEDVVKEMRDELAGR